MNFFKKLQDSLKKTSEKFTNGIDEIFNKVFVDNRATEGFGLGGD